ncbi:MAG TPA: ThuA domain-containing protein [Bacteroidales bacterium]|nr:ThuA domain-containing protein [Bacteroidales bacterium]
MKKQYLIILFAVITALFTACQSGDVYKTLIITGQGEHNWEYSSSALQQIFDEAELFKAEILNTPAKGEDMSTFKPDFSKYQLVVLDYNGDSWSDETKASFVDYVRNGGGLVVYHPSVQAFPDWPEYNEMIGLGGFNGRDETSGPLVYYGMDGVVVDDTTKGPAGAVEERADFEVRIQVNDHPVTQGLPVRWMQANDVMLTNLRGPAKELQILATNSPRMMYWRRPGAQPPKYFPVLMAINYGNGRVFNTVLGNVDDGSGVAMQSVGFIATLLRGAEWAASGSVTQEVPFDFPTAAGPVIRTGFKAVTLEEAFDRIGSYETGSSSTKYMTFIRRQITDAAGDEKTLLDLEKKMVNVLKDANATADAKKLILRELSWMGTDYCIDAINSLSSDPELQEMVDFALTRLQAN